MGELLAIACGAMLLYAALALVTGVMLDNGFSRVVADPFVRIANAAS
jgi:hypothetical protein